MLLCNEKIVINNEAGLERIMIIFVLLYFIISFWYNDCYQYWNDS